MNKKNCVNMSILAMIIGEFLRLYGMEIYGLIVHIINIVLIIFFIIFGDLSLKTKNFLQSLELISILIVINTSLPTQYFIIQEQYIHISIYAIMIFPLYMVIKKYIECNKEKTNTGKFYHFLPIGLVILSTTIIANAERSSAEVLNIGANVMIIFLILLLIFSLTIEGTKYWNEYNSDMIKISSGPLLLIFITIIIFKIVYEILK